MTEAPKAALQQLDQGDDDYRLSCQGTKHPLENVGLKLSNFGSEHSNVRPGGNGVAQSDIKRVGLCPRLIFRDAAPGQRIHEGQLVEGHYAHAPTMKPLTRRVNS